MSQVVAYDNSKVGNSSGSPTITDSFIVGNNSDRLLIVAIAANRVAPVSAVTYNGVSMTLADPGSGLSLNADLQIWILYAPAIGTNNIVISNPGPNNVDYTFWSFYNAKQSGQPEAKTIGSSYASFGPYQKALAPASATALMFGYGGYDSASITCTPAFSHSQSRAAFIAGDCGMQSGSNHIDGSRNDFVYTLGLMYFTGAPSAETTTILETSTISEVITISIGRVIAFLETITGLDTLVSLIRGRFVSALETITGSDIFSSVFKWIRQTKNSSIWTDETKN